MVSLPVSIDLGLGPALNTLVLLFGLILLVMSLLVVIVVIIYLLTYKIKAIVFPLVGSGRKGELGPGKQKRQRFKWNRKRTAWKPLYPLFGKREVEPFPIECMYSGNNIIALELPDKTYLPIRINLDTQLGAEKIDLKTLINELAPVPHYLRKWNEIELQEDEVEASKSGAWEQNKSIIVMLIVIFLCLLLCGLTIYFTFKYAGGKFDQILNVAQNLVDTIKNNNVIPGRAT